MLERGRDFEYLPVKFVKIGNSIYMHIPAKIVNELKLKEGDYGILKVPNDLTLKQFLSLGLMGLNAMMTKTNLFMEKVEES